MDALISAIKWTLTNVFGNVSIFMGLLVFVGLLVTGKKFYEAFSGFIKATVGYMVFSVASSGFTSTFRPILFSVKEKFGTNVLILDGYYGTSIVNEVANNMGRALSLYTIGMFIVFMLTLGMVYLKKITKYRCVNIAGNTLNANAIMAFGFCLMIFPAVPDSWLLVFIVAFGLLNLVAANLVLEDVQDFTDGAGFTVFHSQTLTLWLACRIGDRMQKNAKKTGKKIKHWDEVEFPGWMSIFEDITVSSSLVMLLVFGALMLFVGQENIALYDAAAKSKNFGIYIFQTCMQFGCYIVILTTGIRMFVSELSVAFNGISDKLLRGGVPALDIACTLGFMPNPSVLTIGFFVGTAVDLVLGALLFGLNAPFVAIMGFTSLFFEHGPIAVFADRKGGIKLQMMMNVLCSCVQVLLGGFICYSLGLGAYGGFGITSNWAYMLSFIIPLLKYLGVAGIVIVLVVALVIPQIQYFLHKDTYFLAVEDWEKYKEVKAAKEDK